MSCHITCLLGFSLLGSSLAVMLFGKDTNKSKLFRNSLDSEQLKVYERVIKERRNIYIKGMILGLVLATIVTSKIWFSNNRLNKTIHMCTFMFIALGTNYIYYTLSPKKDYLLSHLVSSMQIEAWLNQYKEKQFIYHLGSLVSAIAYLLIAYGLF